MTGWLEDLETYRMLAIEGRADVSDEADRMMRELLEEHSEELIEAMRENESLRLNYTYPWCPGCCAEVRSADEDGCCNSCGADPIWPESKHIEALSRLHENLHCAAGTTEAASSDECLHCIAGVALGVVS